MIRGSRLTVEQHVDSDSKSHLKLMCGLVSKQRQEIEDLRQRVFIDSAAASPEVGIVSTSITAAPADSTSAASSAPRGTDGTLLWKISNFSRLLKEARQSPSTRGEVVSSPFYTHKFGYKLVASVFPNGDGEGADGKFLSLYVKILPGDFDDLLEWPFTHPIKFTIVDQSGSGRGSSIGSSMNASTTTTTTTPSPDKKLRHIEERFDPDPNWKTFQKPDLEATAADCLGYGYPKYVSHEVLLNEKRNYVVDDAVFIRIQVDLSYSHIF